MPASPARLAIDAVLADGRPHGRAELLEAGTRVVPPGPAWRVAERRRRRGQRSGGHPETSRQVGDEHQAVAAGARAVALDALLKGVRRGTIRRLPDGTFQTTTAQAADPCTTGA